MSSPQGGQQLPRIVVVIRKQHAHQGASQRTTWVLQAVAQRATDCPTGGGADYRQGWSELQRTGARTSKASYLRDTFLRDALAGHLCTRADVPPQLGAGSWGAAR